ncbi:MAG: hypothetical protein J7605_24595 [Variovorax sp.]|nr:hypothetical protein [Variovorax sp.]
MNFLHARGTSLGVVVLVMWLVTGLQAGISYSVGEGALSNLEPGAFHVYIPVFFALRIALLLLLALLWLLGRKRVLFLVIIAANAYFTLALLLDVIALMRVLGGLRQAAASLLIDAALMSLSNMFIFSIWYWIVDPPGVEEDPLEDEPWAFLFPQRGGPLPHYENWSPGYADYLFIGFTTNFAFSPTDALPLTRTAKMLMLVQSGISVVIVTGIAGGAINALVGSA